MSGRRATQTCRETSSSSTGDGHSHYPKVLGHEPGQRLVWCPTDENAADSNSIFTKSLGTRKFKKFQAFLLVLPQDGEFKALICRMLFQ